MQTDTTQDRSQQADTIRTQSERVFDCGWRAVVDMPKAYPFDGPTVASLHLDVPIVGTVQTGGGDRLNEDDLTFIQLVFEDKDEARAAYKLFMWLAYRIKEQLAENEKSAAIFEQGVQHGKASIASMPNPFDALFDENVEKPTIVTAELATALGSDVAAVAVMSDDEFAQLPTDGRSAGGILAKAFGGDPRDAHRINAVAVATSGLSARVCQTALGRKGKPTEIDAAATA